MHIGLTVVAARLRPGSDTGVVEGAAPERSGRGGGDVKADKGQVVGIKELIDEWPQAKGGSKGRGDWAA